MDLVETHLDRGRNLGQDLIQIQFEGGVHSIFRQKLAGGGYQIGVVMNIGELRVLKCNNLTYYDDWEIDWDATTKIEGKIVRIIDDNEGDHIEVEGFITRFVSDQDFDVFGIPVTTIPGTTVYEGGTAADLGLNLKVEVEGEFNGSGVLVATKVDIKSSTAVRVTGLVDSVSGDTLVILGISINTDAINTRFEDKTNADVDPLHIGDINTGEYVEARGQELPVGQVTASLVERDDARVLSELRGFVETGGVSRPNLTVLGVTIVTDGSTIFRDSNKVAFANADDFWAAVGDGSLIDMNGTETGVTTLLATEVELEME